MRYFFWACACLGILSAGCTAFGVTAPAVMAAEAAVSESPAASSIWLILAGEGAWGAVVMAVLGVIYSFVRPYLIEWAEQRRLAKLLFAVESGVKGVRQGFAADIKEANADGKLTEDDKNEALAKARKHVVSFMASQGVDALKVYGPEVIDMLCEWMLAKTKLEGAAAALAPLPDLAP